MDFLYLIPKSLPGLGSNLGIILMTNDLTKVIGRFNADSLTNSMHESFPRLSYHFSRAAWNGISRCGRLMKNSKTLALLMILAAAWIQPSEAQVY
jgi:hypothetical protein